MEKYVPDIYQKSIYTIDYSKLCTNGIKCLLFDLDNTLVPFNEKEPNKKLIDLFSSLKEKGFKIVIFSNNSRNRLKPFKDGLEVDCCARAGKPSTRKFLRVIAELNYQISEVAIIGDQLFTDILGGNKVGITTILINPVSKSDLIITVFNRVREKFLVKKLSKMNLFYRGRYYE